MDFELNLSLKELQKRTDKEYLKTIKFVSEKDECFVALSENDKKILALLDKAGKVFDKISLKLDNKYNLLFLEYLIKEIKEGNERARLTKILFDAQKGMFSPDTEGNKISLVKNIAPPLGLNFYPDDLSVEDFHKILNEMLDNKEYKEVAKILSNRSVVRWVDEKLVGIDYVDYFKEEFTEVAIYLKMASDLCEKKDKRFKKFLKLQAKALQIPNPKLDAKADILWASIVESKFEFTITRECYDDRLTSTILENKELMLRLKDAKIEIFSKDCLGARVGLVNKEGTQSLKTLSTLNTIAKNYMPLKDQYEISKGGNINKQTALDVDIVNLYGNEGEYRAGIVLAQNLPNNDKLSLKLGGGRKNVYHRQIRLSKNNKFASKVLSKNDLKYYSSDADHLGTILHENTHSLGPDSQTLGAYSSIMEEFKADMGIFAFLNEYVKAGLFTETQIKEIITTGIVDSFLKAKPNITQAHRVRTVMILNRFLKEKAIEVDKNNKLKIDYVKVIEVSKTMLYEVVSLQLLKSVENAKKYVEKYFKWNSVMTEMAKLRKSTSKILNGRTVAPLAEYLEKKY